MSGATRKRVRAKLLPLALTAVSIVAVAAWLCVGGERTRASAAQSNGHVVLVSIDGFAAFHLDNHDIDLPNIRALVEAGAVAKSSETVFPSVTHPSHTTLVTGVTPRLHGVIDKSVTDRRTGRRFHITNLPRRESVRVPTLFDALHGAGRSSAAFFWPETRDDPAIADNIAEVFRGEGGRSRGCDARPPR